MHRHMNLVMCGIALNKARVSHLQCDTLSELPCWPQSTGHKRRSTITMQPSGHNDLPANIWADRYHVKVRSSLNVESESARNIVSPLFSIDACLLHV
jgi:hypothetical protein